jgi:hypothetical protein
MNVHEVVKVKAVQTYSHLLYGIELGPPITSGKEFFSAAIRNGFFCLTADNHHHPLHPDQREANEDKLSALAHASHARSPRGTVRGTLHRR